MIQHHHREITHDCKTTGGYERVGVNATCPACLTKLVRRDRWNCPDCRRYQPVNFVESGPGAPGPDGLTVITHMVRCDTCGAECGRAADFHSEPKRSVRS